MNELSVIRVPRANKDLPPLVIDLAELYVAVGRGGEVAFVNSHKAPELLATFNRGYLNASRIINALEYELIQAESLMSQVKAIILVDRMKDLLAERGLANSRNPLGSEDIRQAMYELDPEFRRAKELVGNLTAYIKSVTEHRRYLQNSYESVKKIIGTEGAGSYARQNPGLAVSLSTGGTNNQSLAIEQPLSDDDDFFGTAK